MEVNNSKNVNTGYQQAGDNIINGDGNTIINLKEAAEYKSLQEELEELNKRFENFQAKINQYPDDEDFKGYLLEVDKRRQAVRQEMDVIRNVVGELNELFKSPIYTTRLHLVKSILEAGELEKARDLLEAEAGEMLSEQKALLEKREKLRQEQEEAEQQLQDNADDYLLLARLTSIKFTLPDRFEKTKEYFKKSLSAQQNRDNTFAFALFLDDHNQLPDAQVQYTELLQIDRELVKTKSEEALPGLATTLNNLGVIIMKSQGQITEALKAFSEALKIRRYLAKTNRTAFLPGIADTLNNIGNLQAFKKPIRSEKYFSESLKIKRYLAKTNRTAFLPSIADTLDNIGNLHLVNLGNPQARIGKPDKAEKVYTKALHIRLKLAVDNPYVFLPDLATSLNNLGVLLSSEKVKPENKKIDKAELMFTEALTINRRFAKINSYFFNPRVAGVAVNLSRFYLDNHPDRERSLAFAREATVNALPFMYSNMACRETMSFVNGVIAACGLDLASFLKEVMSCDEHHNRGKFRVSPLLPSELRL